MSLDDRRKKILMIAGAGVVLFLFLWTVVLPKLGMGGMDNRIAQKTQELREMQQMYREFNELNAEVARLDQQIERNKDLSLMTELSEIAKRTDININDRVETITSKAAPKNDFYMEEVVEIRIKKISTEEFIRFLYAIEHSTKLMRAKKISAAARFDDPKLLDVIMEVSTFKPESTD